MVSQCYSRYYTSLWCVPSLHTFPPANIFRRAVSTELCLMWHTLHLKMETAHNLHSLQVLESGFKVSTISPGWSQNPPNIFPCFLIVWEWQWLFVVHHISVKVTVIEFKWLSHSKNLKYLRTSNRYVIQPHAKALKYPLQCFLLPVMFVC